MKYINDNIVGAVKMIAAVHPETVFCGSLGLVINGKLERNVKDIDVITDEDHYRENNFFPHDRAKVIYHPNDEKPSHHFLVGKDTVSCFKLNLNGVKVDVLYNEKIKPEYTIVDFDGMKIRVENPESAIKVKKLYVTNDKAITGVMKHLKDLILMDVDKDELIEIIDKCLHNLKDLK